MLRYGIPERIGSFAVAEVEPDRFRAVSHIQGEIVEIEIKWYWSAKLRSRRASRFVRMVGGLD